MKRISRASTLAGLLAACAVGPAWSSHAWNGYHWARMGNPFSVSLIDNMTTAEWDGILGSVSTDWTASSVLDTPVAPGDRGCRAQQGHTVACNRKFGFSGWLGLAQIWVSGEHIIKAVAKVNDTYFDTSTYNDPNAKRHVLCQEVGHTLGLDHQHAAATCMNDQEGLLDPAYVSPNAHDYEQLDLIYNGHVDGSNSSALLAAAVSGEAPDEPGQFGAPAGKNLFVLDLGGGLRLFTRVIPAPSGRPDPGRPE